MLAGAVRDCLISEVIKNGRDLGLMDFSGTPDNQGAMQYGRANGEKKARQVMRQIKESLKPQRGASAGRDEPGEGQRRAPALAGDDGEPDEVALGWREARPLGDATGWEALSRSNRDREWRQLMKNQLFLHEEASHAKDRSLP